MAYYHLITMVPMQM